MFKNILAPLHVSDPKFHFVNSAPSGSREAFLGAVLLSSSKILNHSHVTFRNHNHLKKISRAVNHLPSCFVFARFFLFHFCFVEFYLQLGGLQKLSFRSKCHVMFLLTRREASLGVSEVLRGWVGSFCVKALCEKFLFNRVFMKLARVLLVRDICVWWLSA